MRRVERPRLEDAWRRASGVRFLCAGDVVRPASARSCARRVGLPLPVDSAATHDESTHLLRPTREALLARGVPPALLEALGLRPAWRLPPSDPGRVALAVAPLGLEAWQRSPSRGPGWRACREAWRADGSPAAGRSQAGPQVPRPGGR